MPKPYRFICVDLQNDFASKGGKHYRPRPCVPFIVSTLLPFLRERGYKVAEIISDYQQPRRGDLDESCVPGTWGSESLIPADLRREGQWVKSMNDPTWMREIHGVPPIRPPYPQPQWFTQWLNEAVGWPEHIGPVVLFGLTLDCCVLCTAIQMCMRGYSVRILYEGTDTYQANWSKRDKSGLLDKHDMLFEPPFTNWARPITWPEVRLELLAEEVPA